MDMPQKAKFTKAEIVYAAMEITKENGLEALTARELGKQLGSSSRPIFTVFQSMEEVKQEVLLGARIIYNSLVKQALQEQKPFKAVGTSYITFALKEPRFFQLLFMNQSRKVASLFELLDQIDDYHLDILHSMMEEYDLKEEVADRLYQHLWIYTHGMASLCATGVYQFSAEEIEEMISEVCISILIRMKGEAQ